MDQTTTQKLIASIAGQLVVHGRRENNVTIEPQTVRDAIKTAKIIVLEARTVAREIIQSRSMNDE